MSVLLFFGVCLGAAFVGSISGIGGGVIIKPLLDLLSGHDVFTISFLSGCAVLSMAVVSLLRQRSADSTFEVRRGTWLAVGSAVGGVLGKLLFDAVSVAFTEDFLGICQSLILLVLLALLLVYQALRKKIKTHNLQNGLLCALLGLSMGMVSAFLGIGGGPFNLAILSFFFSMDNKTAALHSLYIILFSQATSLISTIVQQDVPTFTWPLLAAVVLGGVLGGFFGSLASKKTHNKHVGILYTCVLVFVLAVTGTNLVSALL